MPRVIDHAARRGEIADALLTLAGRDGIHQVSVRTVAEEAGTSPSALRHYFATQDELLAFAMESIVVRVLERVAALQPRATGSRGAQLLLEQLLPMDAERRVEIEVYLAFVLRAAVEPGLRPIRDRTEAGTRDLVTSALHRIRDSGGLGDGRAISTEVDLIYPLVDGLALHAAMRPDRYPPAHLRRVLRRALDRLSTPTD